MDKTIQQLRQCFPFHDHFLRNLNPRNVALKHVQRHRQRWCGPSDGARQLNRNFNYVRHLHLLDYLLHYEFVHFCYCGQVQ